MPELEDEFGGFDAADDGAAGWDWDDVLSVPGVDYVGPWRAAKCEADTLNEMFAACGLSLDDARAVAASVRIWVTPAAARRLAGLLSGVIGR